MVLRVVTNLKVNVFMNTFTASARRIVATMEW